MSSAYRWAIAVFTFPILFAVGLLLTPWQRVVESLSVENAATIVTVVGVLVAGGQLLGRRLRYPAAEGRLVALARAAMGGSGDVAILTAAGRMDLMAFAQVSTRIGGAATVALALVAAGYLVP